MPQCPNCGHHFQEKPDLFGADAPKKDGRAGYTEDFERAWAGMPPAKNASKSDAYKSWQKTAKVRPPIEILMRCIEAYRKDIEKRARQRPKDPPPVCHMSTWINGRRWEGFMADADRVEIAKAVEDDQPSWAKSLVQTIGTQAFNAWFKGAEYEPGPPPVLRLHTALARNYISSRFSHILDRCLGDGVSVELVR